MKQKRYCSKPYKCIEEFKGEGSNVHDINRTQYRAYKLYHGLEDGERVCASCLKIGKNYRPVHSADYCTSCYYKRCPDMLEREVKEVKHILNKNGVTEEKPHDFHLEAVLNLLDIGQVEEASVEPSLYSYATPMTFDGKNIINNTKHRCKLCKENESSEQWIFVTKKGERQQHVNTYCTECIKKGIPKPKSITTLVEILRYSIYSHS